LPIRKPRIKFAPAIEKKEEYAMMRLAHDPPPFHPIEIFCFRVTRSPRPPNMNRPPRVALIVETSGIYGRRIVNGIARYLRYHSPWSMFLEQHELGAQPPAWLSTGKWDGILSRPTNPALARQFQKMAVPVVDLNDLFDDLALPWVGSDHFLIGKTAATYFLERGYRHFAFAGFSNEHWAAQRRDGFCQTVAARGFRVAVYESPWRGPDARRWDDDLEDLQQWLSREPQPLALMACNDVRGLHVLDVAARAEIVVPEQMGVVGVDNEEILCDLCSPRLSSVEPDAEQIGYRAAELLDQLMTRQVPAERRVLIPPLRVVTRRSSDSLAIQDRIVAIATRFIRERALTGCTVDDVLRHVRVSRTSLERRFRQHLHRSPQAEIRAVQLGRVKELLIGTDYTLEHIAEVCGFEHPEYMSVVFKRTCGLTPGQYRKLHSQQAYHPGQNPA
jgi:LacI family transcriptional regulator